MRAINLTSVFERIGQKFRLGLMNRIFRQQGIDGGAYAPPKSRTMFARVKQKKGVKVAGSTYTVEGKKKTARAFGYKRLWVTGNYAKSAFNYVANPNSVTVFASENLHPDGATYSDITKGNSRNFPRSPQHKGTDNRPMVFPKTPQEVGLMKDEMNFAGRLIKDGVVKYFKDEGLIGYRKEINIG